MNWRFFPSFRRDKERELDDELRFHFDQSVKDHIAAGLSPEEAQRQTRLEFGGFDQVKEECRDERRGIWLEQLWQDTVFALRQLRKAPAFAITAVLTTAIGIGMCTSLFSVVNAVLLRPLPLPDSERVVFLSETRPPNEVIPLAPAAYLDWAKMNSTFQDIAAARWEAYNAMTGSRAVSLSAQSVTANFFRVIGVNPMLGRGFVAEEEMEGHNHVVILSNGTWKSDFGGRANVIGETMLLNDTAFTIVGVMPDQDLIWNPAVFTPHTFSAADRTDYGSHGLGCMGRLKAGVTLQAAKLDLASVTAEIGRAHPDSNKNHGAQMVPLMEELTGNVRLQLWVLLGAVGFLLLIASVNVANLLLARTNARAREISVRIALGAGLGRIVRQFIGESLLITGTGGVLGTLLAYLCMESVARFARQYLPRTDLLVVDGTVLATMAGLMLVVGVGVGLVPAIQTIREDLIGSLKDAGRSSGGPQRHRVSRILVVVEIGLALMLLVGTGLLGRSLFALQRADQGFKTKDVYFSNLSFNGQRYASTAKTLAFMSETLARTKSLPAIHSAAFSTGLPMLGMEGLLFQVVGTPKVPKREMPVTSDIAITPEYFQALSIPLVQGRNFTAEDGPACSRVVIITHEMAQHYFAGTNPIGQHIMIMTMADQPDAIREIVGVAGDVKPGGPQSKIFPLVYEPWAQRPSGNVHLVVRANQSSAFPAQEIADIIRSQDPTLPFEGMRGYDGPMSRAWFRQTFSMTLLMVFSLVALLLAAIGIYGVMSFAIGQRTREIGIRIALGAHRGQVVRLVFQSGMKLIAEGIVLGVVASLAFSRLLGALLFNTASYDPVTFLAVALLLAGVGLAACWVPSRRATKVDPIITLRAE